MNNSLQHSNSIFSKISEVRKWLWAIGFIVVLYLFFQFSNKKEDTNVIEYDTALIQQQIKNVGKLVVTEGHFSEVLTYKDQKKYLGDWLSFEKKAIVVINADVTVGFDLSQVKFEVDSIHKVLKISNLPKEEIKISPDYKYYNIDQSTFNEFEGQDYNKINKIARENLNKKINASTLKTDAKKRLKEELFKLYSFVEIMKWKVEIEGETVSNQQEIQKFLH
ncbi:DUF4230 domain-containing protein [Flavobacterium urocaniciphilum]|uniref:DUF4230 domain-containing protein n=1 Tax=Flavobacterium urocaniciphilum TaxID=1299341 RepID=A0A1H9AVB6_9FLAO|nr:DUF4230 domain-containing protein [Flavobacterium urocaniciphilum]SEP79878.1 Protein of unknown function [Flavobacterium urocaniciphilum]